MCRRLARGVPLVGPGPAPSSLSVRHRSPDAGTGRAGQVLNPPEAGRKPFCLWEIGMVEAPGSAPPSRVSIRAVVYARSGPRGSRGRVSPTAGPRSPARVAPPRHVAAHLGAAGPLDASAFRPADAGGARRAAAVIGRTSSSAVRTSRWTCSSKTGPRRRSASIAPHGLESVRDDGDAGGAAVGRLAFDLRRNGSDGGGLPRALLNFGSGSSHCPLRGCPCYATSATMLSGGASASKTPTRESSLQIAARDGEADARR